MSDRRLRILIVADHASLRFGGEAALPLHYFRVLRRRGDEAWLVVHERTRRELTDVFPDDIDRIYFIRDTWLHRMLWACGSVLPKRLAYFTFGMISRLITQVMQRRIVKQTVAQMDIDIVHQPIPVSPKEPSMLFNLGAPVVIGPMNGGMNYPPAFAHMQHPIVTGTMGLGRLCANIFNTLIPGKRHAETLLVANPRTRAALPSGIRGKVVQLVENGVDLSIWRPHSPSADQADRPTRFIFLGRLVAWKAVDVLLEAFRNVHQQLPDVTLEIIGDGAEREKLQKHAASLDLGESVIFSGWLPQKQCAQRLSEADCLVLPSILECGGAVVLEAIAMGIPTIATNWGGPADYIDESCGILVQPASRLTFREDIAAAMLKLARNPELRQRMGECGIRRARELYDWDVKVEQVLSIYEDAIARAGSNNGNL